MKSLIELFKKYEIAIGENQQKLFDLYFAHLISTNENLNLTAITEEDDVAVKHFLDSVLPQKFIPKNASVIDVGSGAGFPAIPLKIVREDLSVTMVDSLAKRVAFLNEVVVKLKLNKTAAVHSRAEDFAKNFRESFDVAVARAVAPLNTLVEYLLPFVKVGGVAVVYKSAKLDEELAVSKKAIEILGGKVEEIFQFEIEEKELLRKVLIIKKVKQSPSKYPRPQNKPKTSPIA